MEDGRLGTRREFLPPFMSLGVRTRRRTNTSKRARTYLLAVRSISTRLVGYRGSAARTAALEGAGLLSRAQRFVGQAYYRGSYDEVLDLAAEYVEVR